MNIHSIKNQAVLFPYVKAHYPASPLLEILQNQCIDIITLLPMLLTIVIPIASSENILISYIKWEIL